MVHLSLGSASDRQILSTKSIFFEKIIEHRFIADIMMNAWYIYNKELKILRSEIDCSGYDIVVDCEGKYRYIQLKTSEMASKRSYQNINISLLNKQNPCIIWIIYRYDNHKNDFEFKYYFWGADIGKAYQKIENYGLCKVKTASRTRKRVENIRNIPKGQFAEIPFYDLFHKLFGFGKKRSRHAK